MSNNAKKNVGRPKNEKKHKRVCLYLEIELYDDLKAFCFRNGFKQNRIIHDLISQFINK
jgi:hypothetical protein